MNVGDRLWLRSHQGATPIRIASVGRLWATLTQGDGRVSLADRHYEGRHTSWGATSTDAEHVAAEQSIAASRARSHASAALASADHPTVQRVCSVLGIDCPDLPTADEILTGAAP